MAEIYEETPVMSILSMFCQINPKFVNVLGEKTIFK
jgi:hypothetical protein